MWSQIIPPAVLAVATGLTYLAYKHPREYPRIGWPLFAFTAASLLLLLALFIGYTGSTVVSLAHSVAAVKGDSDLFAMRIVLTNATTLVDDCFRPLVKYGLPLLAIVAYFGFLLRLPVHSAEEKEWQPKKPVPQKRKEDA